MFRQSVSPTSNSSSNVPPMLPDQCDQMAKLFYIMWPIYKIAQKHNFFAKVRFKFCQILNNFSKVSPRPLKLCLSGEISPNLVTLFTTDLKVGITMCLILLGKAGFNYNWFTHALTFYLGICCLSLRNRGFNLQSYNRST